jgi:hypothetical protein
MRPAEDDQDSNHKARARRNDTGRNGEEGDSRGHSKYADYGHGRQKLRAMFAEFDFSIATEPSHAHHSPLSLKHLFSPPPLDAHLCCLLAPMTGPRLGQGGDNRTPRHKCETSG